MISIQDVELSFGGQSLFEGASLYVNEGERFALVGPNGSGKSTLFRMLLGELEPDRGRARVRKGAAVGHLPQENAPVSENHVLEEALRGFRNPDDRFVAKAKAILMGLGFKVSDFERPLNQLSGGWAMRVAMARLLLSEPDVMLLDEPTNHLDLYSLLWFRNYIQGYRGTLLLISHDRAFINAVCGAVVSIHEQKLNLYRGNYENFLERREAEKRNLEARQEVQRKQIEKMEDWIDRNRARASTARRAQSMIKKLGKIERIEIPPEAKTVKIPLPQPPRGGKEAVILKGVSKSYGKVPVFKKLDFLVQRGQRLAFVGPNGAGKSTLLRVLAGVLPFEQGERRLGHQVTVGYHSQHRAGTMDPEKTVLEEAASAERNNPDQLVRDVLGAFLFSGDFVEKKVKVLSGGEKSRLSLVKILLDPPNLLLLDEPTTHLDMDSVNALISALEDFAGTLVFISHDVHFINTLADHVVYFKGGKVIVYPGNFELFQWRLRSEGLGF